MEAPAGRDPCRYGATIVVVYPGGVTGPDQPVLDSNREGLAE
ncbi:hypothetical protein BH24ACT4_BH24ACT4_05820 [soil metagenome]